MNVKVKDKIFRQYDIRGVVGEDLDPELMYGIGRAFGTYLKKRYPGAARVSVGRDVRISSDELAGELMRGLADEGFVIYDVGPCPTPLQYFSLYHLDLDGGIMVTGSHNPPEYNGLKMNAGKETLYGDEIRKIRTFIEKGYGAAPKNKGRVERYDIINAYKEYMRNEFSSLSNRKYPTIKLVVDGGNGTAGLVAPELFGEFGCDVIPLFCEPDGRFPNHHPDPTVVDYIRDLIREVKDSEADFGVGYDGDADRIGIVDKTGEIIWGDQLMIILSREILERHPGARIIGDVKCSQILFDDIKMHGGVPVMWKTGHSLIKRKMRDEKAKLAGEFSGHIFIADRYFGYDDAIYATLRLIEILKSTGKGITELLDGVPKTFSTPEIRKECPDSEKLGVVERVRERFTGYSESDNAPYSIREVQTIDGIRVVFEKGWGLVRVSNTQPVIVMRFEAIDQASLYAYRQFVEGELSDVMRSVVKG